MTGAAFRFHLHVVSGLGVGDGNAGASRQNRSRLTPDAPNCCESKFESTPPSHLFCYELSAPVGSQQFRPRLAFLPQVGGCGTVWESPLQIRRIEGVASADLVRSHRLRVSVAAARPPRYSTAWKA